MNNERDCNTCAKHVPGNAIPTECRLCLNASFTEDGPYLPQWKEKPVSFIRDIAALRPRNDDDLVKATQQERMFKQMEQEPLKKNAPPAPTMALPSDSATRKNIPMASGLLDYFPAALAEVAFVSFVGNQKHNPGQPLHHARGKSMDHADCIMRHLTDRGTFDDVEVVDPETGVVTTYGVRHSAYVAWRALALLQQELEDAGAPMARGAK